MIAGRLKHYSKNWASYTSDKYILEAISGMRINFFDGKPYQSHVPHELSLSGTEKQAISSEIDRLIKIGVVVHSDHENNQYVSTIFARQKKDGKHRMILNLSKLNDYVEYLHFKMDTLETAIKLVTPDCYMASIDLSDAYYSVPIHKNDQKYLKFTWRGQLYHFTALPNGLSSGPREFTKILKPPFAHLRNLGHIIIGYIDDTLLIAQNQPECAQAVTDTTRVLGELGFIIHPTKSVLVGTHEIIFLGFIINSKTMTVKPTKEKCTALARLCKGTLAKTKLKIQHLASVIGKIVAMFPGSQYGPLHYRELEKAKTQALKLNRGNYDAITSLGPTAKAELTWWVHNAHNAYLAINKGRYDMTLSSDASGLGWGIFDGKTEGGGRWNDTEASRAQTNEINYLELWAAFMALRAYCVDKSNIHVQLKIDNTTAIAYLNKMGGTKSFTCNELAKEIWDWCVERNIWVTACHIPGVLNIVADRKSRVFNDETEWHLNRHAFNQICEHFGRPEIDIFASRLNTQLPRFVSWQPDPDAEAIDAFTVDWAETSFYAFPPFCLIAKCLQKVTFDGAEGLMVVPHWPTQPWFARLTKMLTQPPLLLHRSKTLVTQAASGRIHPLHNKLSLMCCRLSGRASGHGTCQKR